MRPLILLISLLSFVKISFCKRGGKASQPLSSIDIPTYATNVRTGDLFHKAAFNFLGQHLKPALFSILFSTSCHTNTYPQFIDQRLGLNGGALFVDICFHPAQGKKNVEVLLIGKSIGESRSELTATIFIGREDFIQEGRLPFFILPYKSFQFLSNETKTTLTTLNLLIWESTNCF